MPIDYNKYRTKVVYLWEDNEEVFVKSDPKLTYFLAKFPHGQEFKVKSDAEIVTRAIYADHEVTKEQYDAGEVIFKTYPHFPQKKF